MHSYFKPCIKCGRGIAHSVKKCPHCGKSNSLITRLILRALFLVRRKPRR